MAKFHALPIHLSTYPPTYQTILEWQYSRFRKCILWNTSLGPAALSPSSEMRKSLVCFSSIRSLVHVSVEYFAQFQEGGDETFQNYFLQVIFE